MYFSQTTVVAFLALLSHGVAAAPQLPDIVGLLNATQPGTDCGAVRSQCQSLPDANQASCAGLAAECCDGLDTTCRTGAGANQATCSADKAACYAGADLPDPYGTAGEPDTGHQAPAPAPGSETETSCAAVRSACQASGDPNEAACAGEAAECCDDAHDACVVGPDANMAVCASERATCYVEAGLPSPYSF